MAHTWRDLLCAPLVPKHAPTLDALAELIPLVLGDEQTLSVETLEHPELRIIAFEDWLDDGVRAGLLTSLEYSRICTACGPALNASAFAYLNRN